MLPPVEVRPCPYCAHDAPEVQSVECGDGRSGFAVVCCECGARGPVAPDQSADVARHSWNQRFSEH